MNRDFWHPSANARDIYFGSDEGERIQEGKTEGEYLRNRLELAFLAGFAAAERMYKQAARLAPDAGEGKKS